VKIALVMAAVDPVFGQIVAIVVQIAPVLTDIPPIWRPASFRCLSKRRKHQAKHDSCNEKNWFRHFWLPVCQYWRTTPQTVKIFCGLELLNAGTAAWLTPRAPA